MGKETDALFVKQTAAYKKARPRCPQEVISYIASLAPSHDLAWDVGTGNGQAAAMISQHFKRVVATDVAEEQLKLAEQRSNITYAVTPRTLSSEDLARIVGAEGSVDLVLICEALHWFDLDNFYANASRVLRKPGGVIAATVYPSRPRISPEINQVLDDFYATVERFWAPQVVEFVEPVPGYKLLPFPFAKVEREIPSFETAVEANLEEFLAYLRSWSAVQTAVDCGEDPLDARWRKAFAEAWGGDAEMVQRLEWPLTVLVGRMV